MVYSWNERKNALLKRTRNIFFERILTAIEHGGLIDILTHTHLVNYPGQKLMVVNIDNYCWVIPFKDDETKGVPYQTLITSVLHKYLTGRLVEKEEL